MSTRPSGPVCEAVYVDDNPSEHFAVQHAVLAAKIPLKLQLFFTGKEALEYLKGEQMITERAGLPAFVLSDYSMPELRGNELAGRIRQLPRCRAVPIIILSASEQAEVA